MEKTCCVTGHREIPSGQQADVIRRLEQEVQQALDDGFTRFVSGFAQGVDQYFAQIVARLRQSNPSLRLEAAIPYRGRHMVLANAPQTKALLSACTDLYIASNKYARDVYLQRNRYMVEQSQRIIAVYDGRKNGGTAYTIRYAQAQGKEVREIQIAPH